MRHRSEIGSGYTKADWSEYFPVLPETRRNSYASGCPSGVGARRFKKASWKSGVMRPRKWCRRAFRRAGQTPDDISLNRRTIPRRTPTPEVTQLTSAKPRRFTVTTKRTLLIGGGALALAGAGATYAAVRGMGSIDDYEASVGAMRAALAQTPDIRELVRFAALAANSHNTQPWKFRASANRIDIIPDFSRRTPAVDPDDHHLFVSLGCAAENLALACRSRERPGALQFDPSGDGAVVFAFGNGPAKESALFDAIPRRQSSRTEYDAAPVSASDLRALTAAAAVPGVDLIMVTDRARIDRIGELGIAGNSAQIADAAFVRELRSWLRFSPRQAVETGDGLFSATTGNPTLPAWLGPHVFDWVFRAETENAKYARQIASTPAIAVFAGQKEDRAHWVLCGQACQRFALQATALGLRHAFVNQPVEVARLRPDLATLVGIPGRRPDLVMRFGHGPGLPYSARRPVESTLVS